MMKQITMAESVGKTIRQYALVEYNAQLVLVFTDETFAMLNGHHDYDGDLRLSEGEVDMMDFPHDILVSIGLMTAEEVKAREDEINAERRERSEGIDRINYERLKRKFEG